MPADIGYSFNPSQSPDLRTGDRGQEGARGMGPQQAVKIWSLRVPERASQGALAPLPLLTSKGSGAPGAGGLDSIVAALMQAFRPTPTQGVQRVPSGVPRVPGGAQRPVPDGPLDFKYQDDTGPRGDLSPLFGVPPQPDRVVPELAPMTPTSAPPPRFTPGLEAPGGQWGPTPPGGSWPYPDRDPQITLAPVPSGAETQSLFSDEWPAMREREHDFY